MTTRTQGFILIDNDFLKKPFCLKAPKMCIIKVVGLNIIFQEEARTSQCKFYYFGILLVKKMRESGKPQTYWLLINNFPAPAQHIGEEPGYTTRTESNKFLQEHPAVAHYLEYITMQIKNRKLAFWVHQRESGSGS